MARTSSIEIGSKVRLTGKHLRNTGQYTGPAGLSRWTVTGITPQGWAVTDEPLHPELAASYTAAELAADPSLAFRRIALGNLERVR